MILGFGSIEEAEREKIKNALLAAAMEGKNLHRVSEAWNAGREKYDKMDKAKAPERYTLFHIYGGAIHYMHIHRRHPFSPDGWAMMTVEEPLVSGERKDGEAGG